MRGRFANYLLALLTVLIGAYLLIVLFAGHNRPGPSVDREGGTRITWTALTPPDGSTPSPQALSEAQRIIASRINGLGIAGSQVVVNGNSVVVTVPGNNGEEIHDIGATGRLYLRPVMTSVPAKPGEGGQAPGQPSPAAGNIAESIAAEKKWRQSTDQGVQFLALQFQATRCEQPDILAGNDDPSLPLATCSTDKKSAYLLAPSILGNDQIESAGSHLEDGRYVVNLKFTPDGTKTWDDYTAAHVGTQTAFTLDSEVASAPMIQEAIPGGRTQISGGEPPFTATTARQLADVLNSKPLPVNFRESAAETVPPKPGATQDDSTSDLFSPPDGAVAVTIGLLVVLISVQLYRSYRWLRR